MENIKGENRNEIDSTPTINEDNVDDVLAEWKKIEPLAFHDTKVSWKEAGKGLKALIDRLRETNGGQDRDDKGI